MYSFSDLKFSPRSGGVISRISFPNGYSASVVCGPYTYGGQEGLYEVAVLHSGMIVYDTPVTSDVLGHLTQDDVTRILNEIAVLSPRRVASSPPSN
jgi:hypothetical protein